MSLDRSTRRFLIVGFLAALVVAVVAAQFASNAPDGLEYVAQNQGFDQTAQDHDLANAPLADYGENLTGSSWVNTAIAGLAGTALTLGIGYAVFAFARRTNRRRSQTGAG